jgi:cytochrome oxidase Cu insertion factor (SCO1/SenC/PrrC family)
MNRSFPRSTTEGGTGMRSAMVATTLAVVLAAACTAAPKPDGSSAGGSVPVVQRGQVAPPFTLPQAVGKPIALSDLHGKPVLLYFSMGPG